MRNNLASLDRLELIRGDSGVAVGELVFGGERLADAAVEFVGGFANADALSAQLTLGSVLAVGSQGPHGPDLKQATIDAATSREKPLICSVSSMTMPLTLSSEASSGIVSSVEPAK